MVFYITMILQKCGKFGAELENLSNRNYHLFVFMTTISQGIAKRKQSFCQDKLALHKNPSSKTLPCEIAKEKSFCRHEANKFKSNLQFTFLIEQLQFCNLKIHKIKSHILTIILERLQTSHICNYNVNTRNPHICNHHENTMPSLISKCKSKTILFRVLWVTWKGRWHTNLGSSANPRQHMQNQAASYQTVQPPRKIRLIS